ncbi:transposase [Ktedonospora formicarum]|uniref:transposase n=1 Tax=Ktedonospora formicarum TaxID=2778364 RepID=UPI001C6926FC|nr:transposase [Ktedonospora formicarum]
MHEEAKDPQPATGDVIGVDLLIKQLATLSDGRTFENPKALRKKLTMLQCLSRRQSRKAKGSRNRQKARAAPLTDARSDRQRAPRRFAPSNRPDRGENPRPIKSGRV